MASMGDNPHTAAVARSPGQPAHEQLRAMAERKLPEVHALIDRAQKMRDWLTTATTCGCDTLAACALFADSDGPESSIHLHRVG